MQHSILNCNHIYFPMPVPPVSIYYAEAISRKKNSCKIFTFFTRMLISYQAENCGLMNECLFLPKVCKMKKQQRIDLLIAIVLVVIAALSRLVLYPHNFSPMIAIAIFGGAVIHDKKYAIALPVLAMLLSDILFQVFNIATGFWGWGQLVGYGIMILITVLGSYMRKITVVKVAVFSVLSSVIFYILSNTSFFLIDNRIYGLYSQDLNGYWKCLVAALPFFRTALIADLVYSAVLFGGFALMRKSSHKVIIQEVKS